MELHALTQAAHSCHNPMGISLPVQTFQPLWSWSSNFCMNNKFWYLKLATQQRTTVSMILYHGTRGYYQSWACTWHNCCIFLHMCHHVGRQANRHLSKHLVSMVIYHIGGQRALYDCSQMLSEKYCSLSGPSKTIWYDAMKNGCSVVYRKQYHVGILRACFKIWSMNAIALIREH